MGQIESWDFKKANTKEYTHGFHTYPAMMIPQIARRLLNLYGKNAKVLLDPFMGSGTSLVEASLTHNIEMAYGFDLNPLAFLISNVKTTPLDTDILKKELEQISYSEESVFCIPTFKNIEFWFKPKIIKDLSILKEQINKIQEESIRNFFLLAFSETVRNCSNTRKKEFKLYRESKEKLEKHNPDVFKEFKRISLRNIDSLREYKKSRNGIKFCYMLKDVREELPINSSSVDIMITSPPYGDSKTTVAYGQFSRLSLQWLGYEDANKVDKNLLGGVISRDLNINIDSPHLKEIISKISKIDQKRAKEVLSFYEDFNKGLYELDRVMKRGGYICFVVGNRTVKGINIPTDKIMIEMFRAIGNYRHIVTYSRNIPNKRMPRINSPTNKKGQTSPTINNEFIFILRKE
jgi:tRNA G10  N-methylase Trm11